MVVAVVVVYAKNRLCRREKQLANEMISTIQCLVVRLYGSRRAAAAAAAPHFTTTRSRLLSFKLFAPCSRCQQSVERKGLVRSYILHTLISIYHTINQSVCFSNHRESAKIEFSKEFLFRFNNIVIKISFTR